MTYIGQNEDEFNAAQAKKRREQQKRARGRPKHGNCEHCGTRFQGPSADDRNRHYSKCPRLTKLKRQGKI